MNDSDWLLRKSGTGRRMRLFCFAYAGGNARAFASWQDGLDPAIEVCAVQLPGRGARWGVAPFTSMPALVRELAALVARHADLPFAFFGHSLGGLLAFEVARYSRLHYLRLPEQLFVSGCDAPRHRSPPDDLHLLPDPALVEKLRHYNGTPPEILAHEELLAMVLPAVRADFALAADYRYRPGLPLTMPISVLAGRQDTHLGPAQIADWRQETLAPCGIHWFDGDHFFIHPRREAVLDLLGKELLVQATA
jgi:medium-chain acyl-[acyl-carrier-protein] hydrolase